ncbi:MAG: phage holin family protein [Saprospiraceae bacterium]
MNTDELLSSAGETMEYGKIYVEQKMDFYRLEMSKRLAKTVSNLATVAVMGFLVMMVVIFFSLALGLILGTFLGSYGYAFLAITGFYVLAVLLIYFFKRKIITNPILSLVIREMLD